MHFPKKDTLAVAHWEDKEANEGMSKSPGLGQEEFAPPG